MSKLISLFKELDAVQHGNFFLTSGKKSDIYVDAKKVSLHHEGIKIICEGFEHLLHKAGILDQVDTFGGKVTGACSLVTGMLHRLNCHGFYYRESRMHGLKKEFEGTLGNNVVLLDDVATTGKSFMETIPHVLQYNAKILAACVVVDRQEGAEEMLKQCDVPLFSLLKLSDLKQ